MFILYSFRRDFGVVIDFLTTVSTDAHTARLRRALSCSVFYVHSLPRGKERTKKARPDVPSGASLSVPLFKEGWGEKYRSFFCISRHIAITSGRQRKKQALEQF